MKVAAFYGKGDVRIEERPVPTPGPNQLVVKINYVGVCGTDVEFYKGGYPPFIQLPMVLGHENSGVVAAVGEGVTDFKVGDKVLYSKYGGTEVHYEGEDYLIVGARDILAILG